MTWLALDLLGLPQPLLVCLTFGALISPTNPVAVMGLLKELHAPASLEAQIAGESLFNDDLSDRARRLSGSAGGGDAGPRIAATRLDPDLDRSGLRGGISVALVLALPPFAGKDILLASTYAVVVFSVLVQGLTVRRVLVHYGVGEPELPQS